MTEAVFPFPRMVMYATSLGISSPFALFKGINNSLPAGQKKINVGTLSGMWYGRVRKGNGWRYLKSHTVYHCWLVSAYLKKVNREIEAMIPDQELSVEALFCAKYKLEE